MCLRQAYERREIAEVKQIKETLNSTNLITKGKLFTALKKLINTNRVELEVVKWVECAINRTKEHTIERTTNGAEGEESNTKSKQATKYN